MGVGPEVAVAAGVPVKVPRASAVVSTVAVARSTLVGVDVNVAVGETEVEVEVKVGDLEGNTMGVVVGVPVGVVARRMNGRMPRICAGMTLGSR